MPPIPRGPPPSPVAGETVFMDIGGDEEGEDTRSVWSAYAEGTEEWSAEALTRRMEVEEASGSGGGGLPPAAGAGAPSIPETYAAKSKETLAPPSPWVPAERRYGVEGAMVTERELPVAHRIVQLLRCPVSEFPDKRPPDIQPDCFEQLILARQQIHLRESRKSFVAPGDLTTGVPLSLQSGAVPLTPSFAQPLPMTPPLQRPFWTDADKEMAQTTTPETWEASAASVRAGESGGGLTSAGPASEDLFLAPQAVVAEEAPLVSPVQSLPMVKPCPYTDVRLQDAATVRCMSARWSSIPQARLGPSVTPAVEA